MEQSRAVRIKAERIKASLWDETAMWRKTERNGIKGSGANCIEVKRSEANRSVAEQSVAKLTVVQWSKA